jgi:hypothetical protein
MSCCKNPKFQIRKSQIRTDYPILEFSKKEFKIYLGFPYLELWVFPI